jgi:hypothetical protein
LFLLVVLVLGLSIRRLNALEVVLVLLFTHMALFAVRFIPLYVIIVSPIIARRSDALLQDFGGGKIVAEITATSERMAEVDSMTRWHLWSAAAVIVAIVLCVSGSKNTHRSG